LDWFDNVVDLGAGIGDGLSFGLTNSIRGATGLNGAVDQQSAAYRAGAVTGAVTTTVVVATATGGGSLIGQAAIGAGAGVGLNAAMGNGARVQDAAVGAASALVFGGVAGGTVRGMTAVYGVHSAATTATGVFAGLLC
jgi:hypothetical protein